MVNGERFASGLSFNSTHGSTPWRARANLITPTGEAVSYLAIARKYRPTTFDEIVGQEHVTRTLKNAITRSRIHHAFLFCGARGVGKTTAARALAQATKIVQPDQLLPRALNVPPA